MVCGDLKSCWVNKGGIPNARAFWFYGAEPKMNTGFVSNDRKEMSLQFEKRIFLMKVLCLLTKYYYHRFTLCKKHRQRWDMLLVYLPEVFVFKP